MNTAKRLMQLLTCALLLLAVAVNRDGKIFGHSLASEADNGNEQDEWVDKNGSRVISTRRIAKDIWGFGGNIPLLLYINEGKIDSLRVLPHSESPDFFKQVQNSGLLQTWNGMKLSDVITTEVDAVAGATLSSSAIIESIKRGAAFAEDLPLAASKKKNPFTNIKFYCVLLVVLSGMAVPIFCKNKKYRIVQLILNVLVLGFWSGTFISLSSLSNFFANGLALWGGIITGLLLAAAFIYPLFGKASHYCNWMCPLGSCQELIGKAVPYKIKISPKWVDFLTKFRECLWLLMMAVMWLGITFSWMDYELFTAFIFKQAAWPVLSAAGIVILLSAIIHRPYCRFVCPTGTTFKFAQQSK